MQSPFIKTSFNRLKDVWFLFAGMFIIGFGLFLGGYVGFNAVHLVTSLIKAIFKIT